MQALPLKPFALDVLVFGNNLIRPCVECGLVTCNFCEAAAWGTHSPGQGGTCLAAERFLAETWEHGQRTSLCTSSMGISMERAVSVGECTDAFGAVTDRDNDVSSSC